MIIGFIDSLCVKVQIGWIKITGTFILSVLINGGYYLWFLDYGPLIQNFRTYLQKCLVENIWMKLIILFRVSLTPSGKVKTMTIRV